MSSEPARRPDFGSDGMVVFNDCFGHLDQVVLDPRFIVRTLIDTEPGHENAVAFLAHLDLQRTAIIVSSLVEVELLELAEATGRSEIVDAWHEQLRSTSLHLVALDGVLPHAMDLMSEFGIPASVAVQVVTAWAAETSVVVTTRPEFAAVGELSLCVSDDCLDAARALRR